MLLELHAHTTRHSACSVIDPVTLVKKAVQKGLQGIIITEHGCLWNADEINELRREAEIEPSFLILAAQEVKTDIGHVLIYGADKSIPDEIPVAKLRKRYPEAALVWAHPFRYGQTPTSAQLANPLLNAVEIFNTNQSPLENFAGLTAWHKARCTAVSGSDTHAENTAAVFPTQFDHPVTTIDDAAREIRAGRCRPFFKEIPKFGTTRTVTEITLGTKGRDENRSRMIVKQFSDTHQWKRAEKSAELLHDLSIHTFDSGRFRVPRIIHVDPDEKRIIEEGQRGNNLFELLTTIHPSAGIAYFKMAARWLAHLHAKAPTDSNADAACRKEKKRFVSYQQSCKRTNNPHTPAIEKLIAFVRKGEKKLLSRPAELSRVHGDYHPKNIIIGHDRMQDTTTAFISVIDFDSTMIFFKAFDIGYFLSQFDYQYGQHRALIGPYTDNAFIRAYCAEAGIKTAQLTEVPLFKIRANLSIAAYLIKVGKGDSPDLDCLIKNTQKLCKKAC